MPLDTFTYYLLKVGFIPPLRAHSDLVREAFIATAKHRGSYERIADTKSIVKILKNNTDLHAMWNKYQKKFNYAADISFSQTIEAINHLTECLYVNND